MVYRLSEFRRCKFTGLAAGQTRWVPGPKNAKRSVWGLEGRLVIELSGDLPRPLTFWNCAL